MTQQEEPLYDFPEPAQTSRQKSLGHQRGRGSLRSISVLDRLLLTVPVWLQLSINPATALHILQREPPGTFLVRKSRTSQRNVLCVRLADDSMPSFVQQFGIREEHKCTLSLETSAISFPDLPRLISFYCVSRDVLPFPLELPEAIAKATSHKELESISHMGVEFWSSHLNVRGPREPPKALKEKKPGVVTSALPATNPETSSESTSQPDSDDQPKTAPDSDTTSKQSNQNPTLFHEFCPITTRSPRELDCGSGQGALCFINPLFLQSQNALSKRRMFKHSLKVRVSMETSTMLSPPLAPPPPPPLMPKTKGRSKVQKQRQASKDQVLKQGESPVHTTQCDPTAKDTRPLTETQNTSREAQILPPSAAPHIQPETRDQGQPQRQPGNNQAGVEGVDAPARMENVPTDSDYMQPSPIISLSHSVSSTVPPIFPKVSPSLSPHSSPGISPSLSPYQSPSPTPRVPFSLSPHDSPSASPSLSPYQSPSPSPKVPFSLSPFTSLAFTPLAAEAYHTPATPSRPDKQRSERDAEGEGAGADEKEEEEKGLLLQMNAASLNDTDSCSSFGSLEGAANTPPQSPCDQDKGTSL
ncbi:ras and Rab interactor 1-like isoform X1 [Echeneis naucrates]|uniref:Ras and Rab interactor 1-like n=1 Tax=Echeneis naucrates TaxID=173247 RepID=A0A665U9Q7_ECHNA|nr:ras and Rab interactor 1-like isoform X1 [Echeneis naucrates]XP_029374400.1 ras and Rab interactor 1-like isoform X1 [Echeneis naucrates]